MSSRWNRVALLSAVLGIAAQGVLLTLAGIPEGALRWWGVHAWTYLPGWVLAGVVVFAVAGGALAYLAPPFPRPLTTAGIVLVGGISFYLLRDRVHLLGDGRLWIASLGEAPMLHAQEPLSFGLLTLTTRDLGGAAPGLFAQRLELVGVALGMLGLALLFGLAARLGVDSRSRWMAFGLCLSSGALQLGFGYVEAYPLLWVSILAFCLLGLLMLRGRIGPEWCGLAAGVAAGMHVLGLLCLPALVLLLVLGRPGRLRIGGAVLATLAPVATAYFVLPGFLPGGIFGAGGAAGGVLGLRDSLIALWAERESLSAWTLRQVNFWALVLPSGLGILLGGLFIRLDTKSFTRRRESVFLGAAAGLLLLPALILDPNRFRGAALDWDVFAVGAVPAAALGALLWAPRVAESRSARAVLAAAVALGCFTSGSFIALNAGADTAIRRFSDLTRSADWSPRARSLAFETLALERRDAGDFDRAADWYERALEQHPGSLRLLRIRAGVLSWAGRHRESADTYVQAALAEPAYPRIWLNVGWELERVGSADSAQAAFRKALEFDPTSVPAMNHLARLLLAEETTRAEGYAWLERSLNADPRQADAAHLRRILSDRGPPP